MSNPSTAEDLDPIVVPIPEDFDLTMDEWLAGLGGEAPRVLPVPTADLLAEARSEAG